MQSSQRWTRIAGLEPDEKTVVARFRKIRVTGSDTKESTHTIHDWGDYGFVMPSAMNSNGSLRMVVEYIVGYAHNAEQMKREFAADSIEYKLDLLSADGFITHDLKKDDPHILMIKIQESAKILRDRMAGEAA